MLGSISTCSLMYRLTKKGARVYFSISQNFSNISGTDRLADFIS